MFGGRCLTPGGRILEGFHVVIEIPIILRDLDAFGHVNNSVYLTYLENARVAYLAKMGLSNIRDISIIIAEITMTYRSPSYYGETLRVGVRVSQVGKTSFVMEYRLEDRETGRLVGTARSAQVAFDYTAQKIMPVPAEWRRSMEAIEGAPEGTFTG